MVAVLIDRRNRSQCPLPAASAGPGPWAAYSISRRSCQTAALRPAYARLDIERPAGRELPAQRPRTGDRDERQTRFHLRRDLHRPRGCLRRLRRLCWNSTPRSWWARYDVALIVKDADGKVHVAKHEKPTQHGAWGGIAVGALVGVLFPPSVIGAAVVGGVVGGVGGHLRKGIARGDAKELGELLEDGEAALIVIGESRVEEQLDKALTRAEKSIEKEIDADNKEFKRELEAAEKEAAAS